MTLDQLELELRARLKDLEQPGLEARAILQAAGPFSASELILRGDEPVDPLLATKARAWAERRREGYPLAYLSGKKGFYKNEFAVAPGVLIPRPETELVIEVALRRQSQAARFADFGCGTGCLGLSLLTEYPDAELWAIDSNPTAVELTQRNATRLGLGAHAVQANVSQWVPPISLDLVVANPPYIAKGDSEVQAGVHRFEPHAALYAGDDGLEAIRAWTLKAYDALRVGGLFVCEIGAGQRVPAREIMTRAGFQDVEVAQDLAGRDRVVSGVKRGG